MRKVFSYIAIAALSVIVSGCVEPFSFDIDRSNEPIVIESYITDVSFNQSTLYPSDGRFFKTTLRYGQNLFGKGDNVSGAQVLLHSDRNETWSYTEWAPGDYRLLDSQFMAQRGVQYKLEIRLPNNDIFESDWESLPVVENRMGELGFEETTKIDTKFNKGEKVIEEVNGIELTVDIPTNESTDRRYLMWQYETTWIYRAGRLGPENPLYQCWVSGNAYLSQFNLNEDTKGGYKENLVFIDVETNERVLHEMSILVNQFSIDKKYYNFLQDLEKQRESSNLFAAPPFNLNSNYHGVNTENPVFGYFSVRDEEAKRMYFSVEDLSYSVNSNVLFETCQSAIPPYAPDDPCDNCLNYSYGGEPSLDAPYWWSR